MKPISSPRFQTAELVSKQDPSYNIEKSSGHNKMNSNDETVDPVSLHSLLPVSCKTKYFYYICWN